MPKQIVANSAPQDTITEDYDLLVASYKRSLAAGNKSPKTIDTYMESLCGHLLFLPGKARLWYVTMGFHRMGRRS